MWLGKRSSGVRSGDRGQLIWRTIALLILGVIPAAAEPAPPASVGPGRIVCNASFCEMGSSARPKERVRVIVSNLQPDDVKRLHRCTGVAKPCIVSIEGTQQGDALKIMAEKITWQD